jgi:phosphatidate cytidylyltransferase
MIAFNRAKFADVGRRSISAVVLAPLVLVVILQGGIWFQITVGLMGVLMAREWVNIVHGGNEIQFAIHACAALCAALLPQAEGLDAAAGAILVLWIIAAIASVVQTGEGSIWAYFGVFYLSLPLLAFVQLRLDPEFGMLAILWCVLVVWFCDVAAYFAGRLIGGRKLAPTLSPKKTWAGLGGAVVGAIVVSAIIALSNGLALLPLALIAALAALIEQAGDILESAMKRRFGVKDAGNLIPGHGGILDRVDGLVAVVFFAAVVGYVHVAGREAFGLLVW